MLLKEDEMCFLYIKWIVFRILPLNGYYSPTFLGQPTVNLPLKTTSVISQVVYKVDKRV